MKILKCPVCGRNDGGLHFKSSRPGTRPYPYVKHYKQRPFCNIDESNISKIEFQDSKLNAWKSVLDTKDWHKISDLTSRYSSIDLYLQRTEIQKIQDELLDIVDLEMCWLKKCVAAKKLPKAFTYDGHIMQMSKIPTTVVDLEGLRTRTEKLYQKNNDSNLLTLLEGIVLVALQTSMIRVYGIKHIPMEDMTREQMTGKQKLRILKGHTREILPIFNPNNRDEALLAHFYGTQCPNPKCRSWRTDLVPAGRDSKGMCHACGKTGFEVGIRPDCPQCHRPFYDSIIREMIKTSVDDENRMFTHCIYCKEEVYFPKKHVEKFSDMLLI